MHVCMGVAVEKRGNLYVSCCNRGSGTSSFEQAVISKPGSSGRMNAYRKSSLRLLKIMLCVRCKCREKEREKDVVAKYASLSHTELLRLTCTCGNVFCGWILIVAST